MENTDWKILPFDKLSLMELHDVLKLRIDVFVVEQECAYEEIDGKDPECFHLIYYRNGKLACTARIAPAGVIYGEVSIGRVITAESERKSGLGKALMEHCIRFCKEELQAKRIKIAAQLYLKDFYGNLGFEKISDVYPWDGIDHIDMRLLI
ncbi:MAG: GNAT family N-acetyltransferase [Cryomorphaceae bacterium]